MLRISNFMFRNSKKINNFKVERRCITITTNLKSNKPDPADQDKRPNLSFMANMFLGRIETSEAFPYPNAINEEEKETISMLLDPVNRFFNEVNDPVKNDDNAALDDVTADGLWELGAFGLQVPQEFGGAQLTNTQYSRMADVVGGADLGVGIVVGAHQSIGFKGILLFGTPEQQAKYLPMVSTGKKYAAFCLTEPSSGSDAGSIRSRAVKSECGKYYILNGSKIWISNGGIAEIMTVFAQTEVTDPKTGAKRDKVTAFVVERSFGGVKSGPPEKKMGIKCSNTTEIVYEDVRIPIENVLGGEGNGFKVAMSILNNGRFGMAGTLTGTMRACIEKATDFASTRTQFGKKINTFQGVKEKLARMSMYHYAAQSMAYMIAGNMDLGSQDYHLEAAISKVFASEAAWYVCDEAIQILGGMGYMKETGLERILRDLRIFRIFEGTNDILRLFVALTGIQYAGSHLKELQKAFKNPTANLGLIFQESTKRAMRSFGMGGVSMSDVVDPSLQDSAKLTAECVELFGSIVESLLIKYNKTIVDQQCLLNRLADAAIDTYAMVVVLSRATRAIKENSPTADFERLMAVNWCIEGSTRAKASLAKINNSQYSQYFKNCEKLANEISKENGIFYKTPIGL